MIKKSLLKIVFSLIIIGFSLSGLLSIGQTYAFFSDSVGSNGNIFTAGILDLSLRSGQSNFVSDAQNMQPGNQVNRDIYIGKTSISSPLKYKVSYELIGGNENFCNQLQLKIQYDHYFDLPSGGYDNRDMRLKYDGPLTSLVDLTNEDFIIPHSDDQFDIDPNDGTEQWFYYSIILPSTIADIYQGQVCNFNFVVKAWQDNIGDYGDGGFTDVEELENTIKAGYWDPPVVLNEFLPNAGSFSEFVELYNNISSPIDLNGFYIMRITTVFL
jgi:predicted ribosomally synthesized peptide with SipW-like signal peptide